MGNVYVGIWNVGKMCGRGFMKWINGDIFYGFWSEGLRDGSGFYLFVDGGCYCGIWSRGLKDGRGIFYFVGSKYIFLKKLCKFVGYYGSIRGELFYSLVLSLDGYRVAGFRIKRSIFEYVFSGELRSSLS